MSGRQGERPLRVLTGMLYQESNLLAPRPATLQSFRDTLLLEGAASLTRLRGTATELGGVIAAAAASGAALVPTIAAKAVSSGAVTREAFEHIAGHIVDGARNARRLDAVALVLHGATAVEGIDDGAGELLARVRDVVGAGVPITATLDLHSNVTHRMVEAADALAAYRTYPHVDLFSTGERATRLALGTATDVIRPMSALRRLPMILPAENTSTAAGPMAEVMERAAQVGGRAGILDVSVTQVQPWLNASDAACCVLVVANGEPEVAARAADELSEFYWRQRDRFYEVELVPVREAVRRALKSPHRPVVLADGADATGSGSSGDSTAILQALLESGARETPVYLSVVDPQAVAACTAAGEGATVSLAIGGGIDRTHYRSCAVTGTVRLLSDGAFTFSGPQFTGEPHQRGRTAVLAVGEIQVVLTERSAFNWDPAFYRSLKLDPAEAQIVVVKSPTAYRAAYEGLMAESILVDGPGPSTGNIRSLVDALDRVRRPIYPFDDVPDDRALNRGPSNGENIGSGRHDTNECEATVPNMQW